MDEPESESEFENDESDGEWSSIKKQLLPESDKDDDYNDGDIDLEELRLEAVRIFIVFFYFFQLLIYYQITIQAAKKAKAETKICQFCGECERGGSLDRGGARISCKRSRHDANERNVSWGSRLEREK